MDSQGETTEEEVDAKEEPCRSLGGLSRARHCSEAPIEEDGIELQSISCQKADSDNPHAEVDRTIKFNLGRPQVSSGKRVAVEGLGFHVSLARS